MYSQALTRHTQPQLCMQTKCHTPTYSPVAPTGCSLQLTGLPYPMAPLPAPHAPRLCCLCPLRTQRPCPPVASPSPQKGLGHPRTRGWWPRLTGLVAEVGGHTVKATTAFLLGGFGLKEGRVPQELQRGPALSWPAPEGRELRTVRVRQVGPARPESGWVRGVEVGASSGGPGGLSDLCLESAEVQGNSWRGARGSAVGSEARGYRAMSSGLRRWCPGLPYNPPADPPGFYPAPHNGCRIHPET